MLRIATPFDQFLEDLSAWMADSWYFGLIAVALIAAVIAIVWVSKVRARSRARTPQYRRRDS